MDQNEACLSDHFGFSFDIDMRVRYKQMPRRRVYNYRKANWAGLNYALRRGNWGAMLHSMDPHIAWGSLVEQDSSEDEDLLDTG